MDWLTVERFKKMIKTPAVIYFGDLCRSQSSSTQNFSLFGHLTLRRKIRGEELSHCHWKWDEKAAGPLTLNSVVDRFPLTKIKLAPTWHFIISSTEWFIVCGAKEPKRGGRLHFQPKLRPDLVFYSLCPGKKLPTNNNVSCNWSEVAGWACSKSALFKRQSAPRSSDAG